ncbi:hypothetical protein LCGC14_1985630 [marine sediment metagenome]|uniref:Uncharacterized protein n=1 Tax=marine sediment metagenome TaxID=412755 RepID=A0A0F9HKV8_9ZZZZ
MELTKTYLLETALTVEDIDQILKNQAIVSIVLNELNLRETGKEYDADPDKLLDKVKEVLDATN